MKSAHSPPKQLCAPSHVLISVAALTATFTTACLLILHPMWSGQLSSASTSASPPLPPLPSSPSSPSDCMMFSIISNSTPSTTTIPPHPHLQFASCTADRDCGQYSVCHLEQCKCYLGYLWSNVSEQCEPKHCSSDEDCISMAYTRCNGRNGLCQCQEEDYYLDWNSQSCRFSYLSSLQMIERSVPIVVVFVALILLSSAIARCYYLRRRGRREVDREAAAAALRTGRTPSNTTVHFFSVYDQIVASDTANFPPPPPYTTEAISPEEVKEIADSTCSHYSTPPPPYTTWSCVFSFVTRSS